MAVVRLIVWTVALIGVLCVPAHNAFGNPYKGSYVADLNTWVAWQGTMDLGDIAIELTISYEQDPGGEPEASFPVDYSLANLRYSHQAHRDVIREQRRTPRDCRSSLSLDIFVLSPDTFNDPDLWEPLWEARGSRNKIYALYDPTPEVRGHSNILFGPHSPYMDFEAMQHEFSHYFWYRYCLADIDEDTEAFARLMEKRTAARFDHEPTRPGRSSNAETSRVAQAPVSLAFATVEIEPAVVIEVESPTLLVISH